MKNRTSYKKWNIETKYINIGVHSSWAQYIQHGPGYKPIWSLFDHLDTVQVRQKTGTVTGRILYRHDDKQAPEHRGA